LILGAFNGCTQSCAHALLLLLLLQVSIVQFSNDTRVEVPLGRWEKEGFEAGIKNMVSIQHRTGY
jgi:hypothetical protein